MGIHQPLIASETVWRQVRQHSQECSLYFCDGAGQLVRDEIRDILKLSGQSNGVAKRGTYTEPVKSYQERRSEKAVARISRADRALSQRSAQAQSAYGNESLRFITFFGLEPKYFLGVRASMKVLAH